MRIGTANNCLIIEKTESPAEPALYRIEFQVAGVGWRSAGVQEAVQIEGGDALRAEVTDFISGRGQRLEIRLSGAGWLRIQRRLAGPVVVRLRLSDFRVGAALEGETVVAVECQPAFYAALKALFDRG